MCGRRAPSCIPMRRRTIRTCIPSTRASAQSGLMSQQLLAHCNHLFARPATSPGSGTRLYAWCASWPYACIECSTDPALAAACTTGGIGNSSPPEERPKKRGHLDAPPEALKPLLELGRLVRNFHQPEAGAISETATDRGGRIALDELLWRAGVVIDEKDPSRRRETVGYHRPERLESIQRHVGEPEAKKDEVVALGRRPVEEVVLVLAV